VWRAFLIAGRFLTRLPLPQPGPVSAGDIGRSAALYPLVGLIIGLLLWGLSGLLTGHDIRGADLAAALVLGAWVWVTGGLHLDGLADTADGWIGGLGERRRTLEIMKDPRSGPFAIMALTLVLLCKWTAIAALIGGGAAGGLVWIPVLGRAQLLLLVLTTAYARAAGMGREISAQVPRPAAWAGLAATFMASAVFLGAEVLAPIAVGGVLFLVWRRSLMVRLGGFTGDTAGALVELSETAMLVAVALQSA
jgi:adenosylcobinamide-GDP ribazoletransferase